MGLCCYKCSLSLSLSLAFDAFYFIAGWQAFGITSGQPYMVNMAFDPMMAGCLIYLIQAWKIVVQALADLTSTKPPWQKWSATFLISFCFFRVPRFVFFLVACLSHTIPYPGPWHLKNAGEQAYNHGIAQGQHHCAER